MSEQFSDDVLATSALAHQLANLARHAIGPNGTQVRVAEEDAGMVRAAFVSRFAEGVLRLLESEGRP